IITTRDKQVLRNCEVGNASIYEVKGLGDDDACKLFRQHAFRQNLPTEDYGELSNRVVAYAKGLPLALKVLGSSLYSKGKEVWESAINKLEKGPPLGIKKILKVSYDGLEKEEKDIFLDIACFFKGENINSIIEILNACDISTTQGINVLIDKCLLTMLGGLITMHDLLQEMGREIVREEYSTNESGKHIRLWHRKDINEVLTKNTGAEAIRGISLDTSEISDGGLDFQAFSKMHKLRFLKLYSPPDPESLPTSAKAFLSSHEYSCKNKLLGLENLELFSAELTYFSWRGCPLKSWPLKFLSGNQVFVKNLINLIHIDLSWSIHITEVPNLSGLLNLKEIILVDCLNLLDISSSSIQNLNNLVQLNLSYCKKLISLPDNIQSKSITLRGCLNLKMTPKISSKVEELDLSYTAIKEAPFVEYPSRLVRLNLSYCPELESLSSNICELQLLQYLLVRRCPKLGRLPDDLGNLEALKTLDASGIFIREIPSSIFHLSKLSSLQISRLSDDEAPLNWVPNSLSRLLSLKRLELINCQIPELPNNLGQLSFLEILDVYGNNFETIPASIKDLSNSVFLNICYCEKLQSLPELKSGLNVAAYNCSSLESISDSSFLFSPNSMQQRINLRIVSNWISQTFLARKFVEKYVTVYVSLEMKFHGGSDFKIWDVV
ncbi:disease resistance-like protein DSC1, partial [Pistacia vera]|uniref:disease resistance-like protein DSC1 n=1 Tax=Pistacia vera TaxID=55513 RepID=UPI001262FE5B